MSNGTLTPATGNDQPQQIAKSNSASLLGRLGERFGVDAEKMLGTLKATAFRQKSKDGKPVDVTTEQMMALLIVADQYHLNPWTREIYAFPQDGGIVPIVGVDGWVRIINERPEFDGLQFNYGPEFALKNDKDEITGYAQEWVECSIRRKDRQYPIVVREFFRECVRSTIPWKDMPRRMLRHKALIQAARIAFGFAGIYDEDEGASVLDAQPVVTRLPMPPPTGRVHHNRIAHIPHPEPQVKQAAPINEDSEPEQPAFDEAKEIARQELIASLNEQLDAELTPKGQHDLAGSLHKNKEVLGPDVHADMSRRYAAKCQPAEAVTAKPSRNF